MLLHGYEFWRVTKGITQKVKSFIYSWHKIILQIFWPDHARKKEVERITGRRNIMEEIKVRRWKWIGHILRMENDVQRSKNRTTIGTPRENGG